MTDQRPIVHCIIAMQMPDGDYVVGRGEPVTLDDALDFVRFGWSVIPDPFDLELLTRWEQLQRSLESKPKWQRW